MDPQLSIIMANQAQAKNGDVILDPFVGSGSLLIPASMFGAFTLGTDIDYLMLHARTRPSRISQKVQVNYYTFIFTKSNFFNYFRKEKKTKAFTQT